MNFFSRLSLRRDTADVVHDLCVGVKSFQPHLAVLFATHHYGPEFQDLVEEVYRTINCQNLIGCTADGVIGPSAEVENQPGVVLWVAQMPDVNVVPFVLDQQDLTSLPDAQSLYDHIGVTPISSPDFIVIPEPYSVDVQASLAVLDASFPGATIVGGMASGASEPGQNRLFLNDQAFRQGMVGVSLSGNVRMTTLVSHGCRPVGRRMVVTSTRGNLIEEIESQPAALVLQELYDKANETDQELMRRGVHVGCVVTEAGEDAPASDLLMRNMMGVTDDQSIAIMGNLRPGQMIQFHVRDAGSATEELETLLLQHQSAEKHATKGALFFDCSARGKQFFHKTGHDISLVNNHLPDCHTAGFFAQGEIGPVGGRTFIHAFTGTLALFSDR